MTNNKPLVSIVTVTLNSEATIHRAIESVLKQTYQNIEHIIIDGLSSDSTLKVIEEYRPQYRGRLKVVSEQDSGIYDAMNKGISQASGDLIGILNSDDWYNKDAIEVIVNNIEAGNDIYHGNIYKVKELNGKYYKKLQKPKDVSNITKDMCINHISCFIAKELYIKNNYDINYKIAADYKASSLFSVELQF